MLAIIQTYAAKIFFFFCSTIIAPQVKIEYEEKLANLQSAFDKASEDLSVEKALRIELQKRLTDLTDKFTPVLNTAATLDAITKKE